MKTRVQKWGNGLALRIPKSCAAKAGLCVGSTVELSVVNGLLVFRPINLDELLRGVTDDNLPNEWDTGPAVGKEAW